jgi:type I restriction-modification system DNA methylase subunit
LPLELDIRRELLKANAVDVMVSIGPNFFYTVTLPCTLWFLDRGKTKTNRKDKVLFIDARHTFRQIDRAHRDFTPEQIEFIAEPAHANSRRPIRDSTRKPANGQVDFSFNPMDCADNEEN